MPTDLNVYCGLLAQQLRANGVKEPKVREVVAQVADHAVATGEDPVLAFGQPIDYAAQWRSPSVRTWLWRFLLQVLAVNGVMAGIPAIAAEEGWLDEVPISNGWIMNWTVMIVIVALVPSTVELWLGRRRAANVGARPRVPHWVLVGVGIIAWSTVAWFALRTFVGTGDYEVVFAAPRWLLGVIGLVGVAAFLRVPWRRDDSLPARPRSRGNW